jgi:UDPglucose 6-dehydrogenase
MTEVFNVGVVGAGYVGLATGACLSHFGHRVVCVEEDEERTRGLKEGLLPFYEPGLQELVSRGVEEQRLSFAGPDGLAGLVGQIDVAFVAVGTPQAEDGSADLSNVGAVARGIGRALSEEGHERERPLVVVNKSTVPVGSGDHVSMLIHKGLEEAGGKNEGTGFLVASNPEFLREGSAIYDSLVPDRIVVGTDSREALDTLRALYAAFDAGLLYRGFGRG